MYTTRMREHTSRSTIRLIVLRETVTMDVGVVRSSPEPECGTRCTMLEFSLIGVVVYWLLVLV